MTNKEWYKNITDNQIRHKQVDYVDEILSDFPFENIKCIETGISQNIEDGAFGLYLARKVGNDGIYVGVDINENYVNEGKKLFKHYFPDNTNHHFICGDSVEFLKIRKDGYNLAHLDSYDLNIHNPFPSMLHHWNEFVELKDVMPIGSIVMIDDNFMKGTTVYWNHLYNGEFVRQEKVPITYDIIGKGTLIYHWVKEMSDEWELIGDHYNSVDNIKVIIRKKI